MLQCESQRHAMHDLTSGRACLCEEIKVAQGRRDRDKVEVMTREHGEVEESTKCVKW
jgi:hypothetical protein